MEVTKGCRWWNLIGKEGDARYQIMEVDGNSVGGGGGSGKSVGDGQSGFGE